MRILLRHTRTGLFFQSPERWTENSELAFDFKFVDRALKFADTWKLSEVELGFEFDDPPHLATVPLDQAAIGRAA